MREIHLVEVVYCEDTRPGHQLEASRKQHEVLCKRFQAKKVILHTILLGVGGSIYTSNTLNHLKELGLDVQKAHKTALKLHAHFVPYAHNCQLLDALFKNPVALKVLVWSRGRLVILQILTSSSLSLVEETHGSSGRCVSFSLINVGSGFTAYVVFLFFSFLFSNSSTGTLVTVAISTAPDGGFHCESMCSQAKPAHIPHNMLREIKVQMARRYQGGNPIPHPCA